MHEPLNAYTYASISEMIYVPYNFTAFANSKRKKNLSKKVS